MEGLFIYDNAKCLLHEIILDIHKNQSKQTDIIDFTQLQVQADLLKKCKYSQLAAFMAIIMDSIFSIFEQFNTEGIEISPAGTSIAKAILDATYKITFESLTEVTNEIKHFWQLIKLVFPLNDLIVRTAFLQKVRSFAFSTLLSMNPKFMEDNIPDLEAAQKEKHSEWRVVNRELALEQMTLFNLKLDLKVELKQCFQHKIAGINTF